MVRLPTSNPSRYRLSVKARDVILPGNRAIRLSIVHCRSRVSFEPVFMMRQSYRGFSQLLVKSN